MALNNHDIGLSRNVAHYYAMKGTGLDERCTPFHEWLERRRELGVLPFNRVLTSCASHTVSVADEFGGNTKSYINFASQDYLGLAQDARVRLAAKAAIDEFGVHSAGSAVLAGRTRYALELEQRLMKVLGKEACTICPTGWAAGFGVIAALIRPSDTLALDVFSHNCLQEGAKHATTNIRRFAHNDLDDLGDLLKCERERDPRNGLFVVVESLYSMDSDSPALGEILKLVRRYDGILILDVAHDFGAMGSDGLGLLGTLTGDDSPDVVMGSFSKTFPCNGGFLACSRRVRDYLAFCTPPLVFSNAMSPMQARVAGECMDIAFSAEGHSLRETLLRNVLALRSSMEEHGIRAAGTPSPIVPVIIGDERTARLMSRQLQGKGLLANLVEYPAVPLGKARFRFQVMSTHDLDSIAKAAGITAASKADALAML